MQAYDISQLRVLVLEKHLLIRRLLTEVFRECGVPTVMSTADPNQAFEMFSDSPVDIIFTDWCADLDGMAFLNRVRKDPASSICFIPVVVVTAFTELHNVCVARDNGMTEYLAKPISAKMIYSRLVKVIESNRPFIRTGDFFGPERRRREQPAFANQNRRAA